jgi:hypothetical protein
MRVWKHLGVLAVTATAACGLDAAGEIATGLDAGTERIDTAAVVPDARTSQTRDASLPSHDASGPFDATLPKDAAEAGNDVSTDAHLDATNDAAKDAQHDSTPPTDVGTEDVTVHHLDGNAPDSSKGDAAEHDATAHDAGEGDAGGHDAESHDGAAHDAGATHDAVAKPDAPVVTQPPNICIIDYSCGSTHCNCNQTCAGSSCGGCVDHQATCPNTIWGTCGTDLTSTSDCGACGNGCGGCGILQHATCSATGTGYACGCADDF